MNFGASYIYRLVTDMLVDTRFIVLIGDIFVSKPPPSADPTYKINFLLSLRNGTNIPIGWENVSADKLDLYKQQLEQDREKLIETWEKNHRETI